MVSSLEIFVQEVCVCVCMYFPHECYMSRPSQHKRGCKFGKICFIILTVLYKVENLWRLLSCPDKLYEAGTENIKLNVFN
jgi:hypothetical protein